MEQPKQPAKRGRPRKNPDGPTFVRLEIPDELLKRINEIKQSEYRDSLANTVYSLLITHPKTKTT